MTIDELTQTTGEWLRGEGASSDVVLSSRIRLARNLADYPFLSGAGESDRTKIYRHLIDQIGQAKPSANDTVFDMNEIDAIDREILVERHLISRQHAGGEGARGVTVAPSETRALMINEEDHLRIQGLRSGLQLEGIWEDVSAVDDAISSNVSFAFDRQLGYLTACPTNVGTGIRVSVMLHLPGLKLANEIERMARAARDMRLAVRGLHGEGTDAVGDLFQISNQTTLGKSETTIIETFSHHIIPKIVDYERQARQTLAKRRAAKLDDKIWRAFGLLANARRMSGEETQTLLSPIRMGIHLGRFDRFGIDKLNELFLFSQPAHLQKLHGQAVDGEERAILRADFLRERLSAT